MSTIDKKNEPKIETSAQTPVANEVKSEEKFELIGDFLKRIREKQNITLKALSNRTKINYSNLEHLENNNLKKLPNKTYIAGYIKSYCKELGLNQKETIERLFETYERLTGVKIIKKESETPVQTQPTHKHGHSHGHGYDHKHGHTHSEQHSHQHADTESLKELLTGKVLKVYLPIVLICLVVIILATSKYNSSKRRSLIVDNHPSKTMITVSNNSPLTVTATIMPIATQSATTPLIAITPDSELLAKFENNLAPHQTVTPQLASVATHTQIATPVATPTKAPTVVVTPTKAPTKAPTPVATPTKAPTPAPTPTKKVTPAPTPTATPAPKKTVAPTPTPAPTVKAVVENGTLPQLLPITEALFTTDEIPNDEKKYVSNNANWQMTRKRESKEEVIYVNAFAGDTWLAVKKDSDGIRKINLKKGQTLLLTGKTIRLYFGNVSVAKIYHNGKKVNAQSENGIKSLVFPIEDQSKFKLPLFIFDNKKGTVVPSDEI